MAFGPSQPTTGVPIGVLPPVHGRAREILSETWREVKITSITNRSASLFGNLGLFFDFAPSNPQPKPPLRRSLNSSTRERDWRS